MIIAQKARSVRCAATVALIAAFTTASATADDIEVYSAQIAASQKPNILFVLDYSGSMDMDIYGDKDTSNPTRLEILKEAMSELLDGNTDNINAGVGSLYGESTTGIRWPISELTADANSIDPNIPAGQFTVADMIEKQVHERDAQGSTATVDALVEAAQYFRGEAVTHNDSSLTPANRHEPHQWNVANNEYSGGNDSAAIAATYSPSNAYSENHMGRFYCNDYSGSGGPNYCENKIESSCSLKTSSDTPTTGFENLQNLWGDYRQCLYSRSLDWTGAKYNSPIAQSCQANAIVLISDGRPRSFTDGDSLKSIVGTNHSGCEDLSDTIFRNYANFSDAGNCGPEIVRALADADQNPLITGSHVTTYTVGFTIDSGGEDFLTLLAEEGNGKYFSAIDPEELINALNDIVEEVSEASENFTSLSIDIDRANFSHDDRAFFGLFTPNEKRSWEGNLKGYFVDETGLVDINGNDATVTTDDGTQFADDAQSFWSESADGNEVSEGGASVKLLDGNRKLYTYTGASIPASGVALRSSKDHRIRKRNSTITDAMMELPDGSAQRASSLDWIKTAPMGDPLHSKSVSVNYGTQQVVYVATNQGFVHAIDATTPTDAGTGDSSGGEELFAFMPQELLRNLPDLELNENTGDHIYGMDGSITRWHTDDNNDGIVNNGESMLLIVGMRRGGTSYIALDVSSPSAPILKWIIDDTNPSFPALEQSWSRMSLISVNDGGTTRRVLVFGAGYDADVQDAATAATASSGNAIYMVDINGDLVWSASNSDHASMRYSIASDLTVIDTDADSIADRLYVGDVGGQIWRVDFENINQNPDVTLLANLQDGHQPFFYPPSVALNRSSAEDYYSISIGSGNRTNPLLTGSQNYFYMIRDTNLEKGAPEDFSSAIKPRDLFDVTNNDIESSRTAVATAAQEDLDEASGWILSLEPNEKSLSSVVTFEGSILATTFEPLISGSSDMCSFESVGRYYQIDVADATSTNNTSVIDSSDDSDTTSSRYTELNSTTIPSSPVVVFPTGASYVQVFVDKENVDTITQSLKRVFWHAK